MLLHLPIVLATLSPVAVSDTVPKFDIVRECRFESASDGNFERCRQDEATALEQLMANWTQFAVADKRTCLGVETIGDFTSYVELLTCLEMARDANNSNTRPRNPQATEAMRRGGPGATTGLAHDHIKPGSMPSRSSR